jgi:hypothetical protein
MIVAGKYWIIIVPSDPKQQIQIEEEITGKWLCFGPMKELHLYPRLIDKLVEEGTLRKVKIARKDPSCDPFPHKECVMCIFTSSDEGEKNSVAAILKDIGLSPVTWKSEVETQQDWLPDGKLYLEAEIGDKKRKLHTSTDKTNAHPALVPQIFISHANEDSDFANEVCERIEQAGLLCWIAPRNIRPGRAYDEEIIDGIETCKATIVLISRAANKSVHVKRELEIASNNEKYIIPVRAENVEFGKSLKYFLAGKQFLDLFGESKATSLSFLLNELNKTLQE